jgi:hypothetical protein
MDDNLFAVTMVASILTFVLSLFGLLPTSRLRAQPTGPLRIVHLLALPVIVAMIYVYLDWVFPNGDKTDRLGYTIGCSLVATFWWFRVARRTQSVDDSVAISLYVVSTVLFGFLCPLMIFFNTFPLFANVRPAAAKAPLILGFVAHLGLYILVLLTTYWFTTVARRKNKTGEPSDGHGAADSAFPDG